MPKKLWLSVGKESHQVKKIVSTSLPLAEYEQWLEWMHQMRKKPKASPAKMSELLREALKCYAKEQGVSPCPKRS